MKLPRDVSGEDLAALLGRYGYQVTRQTGSHIRLNSRLQGYDHSVTIPNHRSLKSGTLNSILRDVASYLEKNKQALQDELFGPSR